MWPFIRVNTGKINVRPIDVMSKARHFPAKKTHIHKPLICKLTNLEITVPMLVILSCYIFALALSKSCRDNPEENDVARLELDTYSKPPFSYFSHFPRKGPAISPSFIHPSMKPLNSIAISFRLHYSHY